MLSLAKIASLIVIPTEVVARATKLLVMVLIKPETGVQAGVETAHP